MLPPNEAPKEFSIATATRPIPRPGNGGEVYLRIDWWMLVICFFFLYICRVLKKLAQCRKKDHLKCLTYLSLTSAYRFLSQSVERNSHTIRYTIITAWSGHKLIWCDQRSRNCGETHPPTGKDMVMNIYYKHDTSYLVMAYMYYSSCHLKLQSKWHSDLLALSAHVAIRNAAELLHPRASRKEKQTSHKWKTEIQILRLRWI